jgi:hypothetical protein
LGLIAYFAAKYVPFALAQINPMRHFSHCLSGILSQTFQARPRAGLFFWLGTIVNSGALPASGAALHDVYAIAFICCHS